MPTAEIGPSGEALNTLGTPDGVSWVGDRYMRVEYFQGLLMEAGLPRELLPEDDGQLTPEDAEALVPWVASSSVKLGHFGKVRMAAHLLREVAEAGEVVEYTELHRRMDRFLELLVARPDGYLVVPYTGRAVQKAGAVRLSDGTLMAGAFEVGPFYRVREGGLYAVDERLEIPAGAQPAGKYAPDNQVLGPALLGAADALVDTVTGVVELGFHPVRTLEGLRQFPSVMRQLMENSPEYWEYYKLLPPGEQVRLMSRLVTNALLVLGTVGTGAAKATSWGSKVESLGRVAPHLSVTGEGALAVRMVAEPTVAGQAVSASGGAVSAMYVVHMANMGGGGASKMKPPGGRAAARQPQSSASSPSAWPLDPKVARALYQQGMAEAQRAFPHLFGGSPQKHHVFSKYLGGPPNGRTVPLDPAYHQLITNRFRSIHPYDTPFPSPARALEIMREVYSKYPLPGIHFIP